MDSAQSNALKRRHILSQQADRIQSEIAEIDRFLALYELFRSSDPGAQTTLFLAAEEGTGIEQKEDSEQTAPPVQTVRTGRNPGMSKEQLKPYIREAILSAGKPLTRGLLLRSLDQNGAKVGGSADRSKNLGTIMWRLKDDFVNLEGFGYWPKSEPYEPAKYHPSAIDTDDSDDF